MKKIFQNKDDYQYIFKNKEEIFSKECSIIELTDRGFKIMNLANYLLQSQSLFNKMGRYHIKNNEMIIIFLEILYDLTAFNSFFRNSVQFMLNKDKRD